MEEPHRPVVAMSGWRADGRAQPSVPCPCSVPSGGDASSLDCESSKGAPAVFRAGTPIVAAEFRALRPAALQLASWIHVLCLVTAVVLVLPARGQHHSSVPLHFIAGLVALAGAGGLSVCGGLPFSETAGTKDAGGTERTWASGGRSTGEPEGQGTCIRGLGVVEQRRVELEELIHRLHEARQWTDLALQHQEPWKDEIVSVDEEVKVSRVRCSGGLRCPCGSGGVDFRCGTVRLDTTLKPCPAVETIPRVPALSFMGREVTSPTLDSAWWCSRCSAWRPDAPQAGIENLLSPDCPDQVMNAKCRI